MPKHIRYDDDGNEIREQKEISNPYAMKRMTSQALRLLGEGAHDGFAALPEQGDEHECRSPVAKKNVWNVWKRDVLESKLSTPDY